VVRAWGRLGYPRRAIALHAAARACVAEHEGAIPADVSALLALPGVGRYTASAVASIGFGRPVAAVDTNVRRVVARFLRGAEPADLPASLLQTDADAWLDGDDPAAWNQAVMDLGREICRPLPRCDACPVAIDCRFRASGAVPRRAGRRRTRYEGSLRQTRGTILDELRRHPTVTEAFIARLLRGDGASPSAAIEGLVRDGIAERIDGERVRLAR
jgi:A/G-specific adenine glycosylase